MNALPSDPLRLMSLIGALCSDLGLHDQALAVLQPLVLLREHEPNARVTLALAQSRAGDESGARQTLGEALAIDPVHDMARVMLAIHLHRVHDRAGVALLQAVLAEGQDADALALAESVREEVLGAPPAPAPEASRRHRYTRLDVDARPTGANP